MVDGAEAVDGDPGEAELVSVYHDLRTFQDQGPDRTPALHLPTITAVLSST